MSHAAQGAIVKFHEVFMQGLQKSFFCFISITTPNHSLRPSHEAHTKYANNY